MQFNSPLRYSLPLIVVLVALRLAIGFHFFSEGADKLNNGFSSAGFLGSAKGPLAGFYTSMLWDADGKQRLDFDETRATWDHYLNQVARYYNFDEKQRSEATSVLQTREAQLDYYLKSNRDKIDDYLKGLKRREENTASPDHQEVASLKGQAEKTASKLKKDVSGLLKPIDELWQAYRRDLLALRTSEQAAKGELSLEPPRTGFISTATVDYWIPRLDLAIGVLLVLGLFARYAAIAGALFLFSVVLSQWPWAAGAQPIFYQSIEMLALILIAVTSAGRFAGLDYFIHYGLGRCCGKSPAAKKVAA